MGDIRAQLTSNGNSREPELVVEIWQCEFCAVQIVDSVWHGDVAGLSKKRISEHGGARSGACEYQKMRPVRREVPSLAMIPCRLPAIRRRRSDTDALIILGPPAQMIENVANLAVRGGRGGCLVIVGKEDDSSYPRLRMGSHTQES